MAYNSRTFFSRKVTFLNTMATVLIVILHSESPLRFGMPLDGEHYPFIWWVYMLTQTAVPLFFFISGLLFYRQCEWRDIPSKLKKRFFSLVIPFFLWNLLFVCLYFVLSRLPFTASRMNLPNTLNTPKDWALAIWHTRFTPLWFVKYLIFYCAFSPLILLVIKNRYVAIAAVLASWVVALLDQLGAGNEYSLLYWLPTYLGGAVMGRHVYGKKQHEDGALTVRWPIGALVLLGVAFLLLYVRAGLYEGQALHLFRLFSPVIIWILTDLLMGGFLKQRFQPRRWMGYTFFIYATHYFIVNVLQTVIRSLLPPSAWVINLTFVFTPVVTLLIIIGMANVLSKYKVYKILTGGR